MLRSLFPWIYVVFNFAKKIGLRSPSQTQSSLISSTSAGSSPSRKRVRHLYSKHTPVGTGQGGKEQRSKGSLSPHLDLVSLSSKPGTPAKRAEQRLGENKAIPPRTVPPSGITHSALGVSCQGGSGKGMFSSSPNERVRAHW